MTAMRLKRYPSPSGGFALGKMGVGATMLYSTPYRYITKGLVSYFDSEVGFSRESGMWMDLATGITYPVSVQSVGSSGAVMLRQDLIVPWTYGTTCSLFYTIGDQHSGRWAEKYPLSLVSGNTVIVGLSINNDWTSTSLVIDGQSNGIGYDGSVVKSQSVITYDGAEAWKSIGGVRKRHWAIQSQITPTSIRIQNSYSTPGGSWCVFRTLVYNRALTAAEIAANYAIDKERFNLP